MSLRVGICGIDCACNDNGVKYWVKGWVAVAIAEYDANSKLLDVLIIINLYILL